MAKRKVLFINQEIAPYVPKSELATMGRDLPQKMQEGGFEIRTFMPKWGSINERRGQLLEVIRLSGMNLVINDIDHPLIIKVASIPVSRVQVYFIDNEDYFLRRQGMAEDEAGTEYADNGERAIFFARGVLETVRKLRWTPDIIQCQGWMAGVVPFYAKTVYHDDPSFTNAKIVTSLFRSQPRSHLGDNFKRCVAFREAGPELLEPYADKFDYMELGKLAIDYSDAVVEADGDASKGLSDYAQGKGMPMLAYPGENYAQGYKAFYHSLFDEK